ncbi:MAG: hypothetical protein AB7Q81_04500 [Gammaproteobacteria bacterium]
MLADNGDAARITRFLLVGGVAALAGAALTLLVWMIAWRSGCDCTVEGAVLGVFRALFALAVVVFLLAQVVGIAGVLRGEPAGGRTFGWRSTRHSVH